MPKNCCEDLEKNKKNSQKHRKNCSTCRVVKLILAEYKFPGNRVFVNKMKWYNENVDNQMIFHSTYSNSDREEKEKNCPTKFDLVVEYEYAFSNLMQITFPRIYTKIVEKMKFLKKSTLNGSTTSKVMSTPIKTKRKQVTDDRKQNQPKNDICKKLKSHQTDIPAKNSVILKQNYIMDISKSITNKLDNILDKAIFTFERTVQQLLMIFDFERDFGRGVIVGQELGRLNKIVNIADFNLGDSLSYESLSDMNQPVKIITGYVKKFDDRGFNYPGGGTIKIDNDCMKITMTMINSQTQNITTGLKSLYAKTDQNENPDNKRIYGLTSNSYNLLVKILGKYLSMMCFTNSQLLAFTRTVRNSSRKLLDQKQKDVELIRTLMEGGAFRVSRSIVLCNLFSSLIANYSAELNGFIVPGGYYFTVDHLKNLINLRDESQKSNQTDLQLPIFKKLLDLCKKLAQKTQFQCSLLQMSLIGRLANVYFNYLQELSLARMKSFTIGSNLYSGFDNNNNNNNINHNYWDSKKAEATLYFFVMEYLLEKYDLVEFNDEFEKIMLEMLTNAPILFYPLYPLFGENNGVRQYEKFLEKISEHTFLSYSK